MNPPHETQDSVLKPFDQKVYKAAYIEKPGVLKYAEIPIADLDGNQLLVRLEGVGLCASNIPVWEGRDWFSYPMAPGEPGHEGWGRVVGIGQEVTGFQIGQRVSFLQGNAFAEVAVVSAEDAISLPPTLDNIPFPGEPFGCLMNIFKRADIQDGQTVAIIGLGFIGLGLAKLCKEKNVKLIALSRRDSALQQISHVADYCIKMHDHHQIIDQINQLTEGKGCERVIECTGKQWPLDLSSAIIGEYGKLIIAGYHQDGLRKVNMQEWNWKAIDVINAHERNPKIYRKGIEGAIVAVEQGILDPGELLTHSFTFGQLKNGLDYLKNCPEGFIKGYINF